MSDFSIYNENKLIGFCYPAASAPAIKKAGWQILKEEHLSEALKDGAIEVVNMTGIFEKVFIAGLTSMKLRISFNMWFV
jgi:hypothetical protein